MSDAATASIGPVPGEERITVIDCLRGAALLGIIIANMRGFNAPLQAYFQPHLMWTWMPDRIAQALVDWLVSGKFITIFAALFGVGFAIQMDRAAARGFGPGFYLRRMSALLLIGVLHSFLLWWGDILITYAVCGYFLLFFRQRTQKTVFVWANIFYWFLLLLIGGFVVAMLFGAPPPPDTPFKPISELVTIYSTGTWREIFIARAGEWMQANGFVIGLTRVLGIFLFGLYIWRQGYLQRPAEHHAWWTRAQRVGFVVGIAGNLAYVAVDWIYHPDPLKPGPLTLAMFTLQSVVVPALSLAYSATVVRLWQQPAWRQRLMPFSYVGRMALTNYLVQSLICTTIFYSYGLGLYGRVGPLADLFLAIAIYSLQVPFSKWWLATHRYGPAEWVWRRMTYGASAFSNRARADSPAI